MHLVTTDVCEIDLGDGLFAIVDASDEELVKPYTWGSLQDNRCWYAQTNIRIDGKKRAIRLHRFLLNPGPGLEVDHINGFGLDNRRDNLRICSRGQNQRNMRINRRNIGTSKYKGVHKRPYNRWGACISRNSRTVHLGTFTTEEDAARAYNKAAKKFFGEFARLNVIGN